MSAGIGPGIEFAAVGHQDVQRSLDVTLEVRRLAQLCSSDRAELDAARREKVLESEFRKPADAEAYRQVTLAGAARQTEILRAQAQAQETTLRGEAEAKATEVNGRAVIAQQIAEHYPAIVAAGASALGNIDNLVVLKGAEGMEDLLGKALTMGGAGLGLARSLMSSIQGSSADSRVEPAPVSGPANGTVPAAVPTVEVSPARETSG